MGGKSKSSQTTSNLQTTNNIVNDGDYAGVGGNVTHDESSNDNSVDNSQEWDVSIDNSQAYDIDNSVENNGDFAGITGNVNILDGGAIADAFNFASDTAGGALRFGEKALNTNHFQWRKYFSNSFRILCDSSICCCILLLGWFFSMDFFIVK